MDNILNRDELKAGLQTWANGTYAVEAAVELLIAHGAWLHRTSFLQSCWIDDGMLGIDWEVLAANSQSEPASGSERRILEIVLGLAGESVPDPSSLGDLVSSLDDHNVARVMNAIWHAAGRHERHQTITVTGLVAP